MSEYTKPGAPFHTNDITQTAKCGSGLPWDTLDHRDSNCNCKLQNYMNDSGDILISGSVNNPAITNIMFWAAAPPTFGTSFSGSGHPYANPKMAYDRTPNRGTIKVDGSGRFQFRIKYPNAYYVGLGTLYVPPHVNLRFVLAGRNPDDPTLQESSIIVDDGIPFRMLTYPSPPSKKPRTSPMFYCEPCRGARSQEEILRARGYPEVNKTPDNFWGLAPPR